MIKGYARGKPENPVCHPFDKPALNEKQMVCCVVLLVLPIPCLKDDEKEPVRKRADWMELVAQRRSTDGIIRVHGM